MKIYTRTGDDGNTHLRRGPRVAKDDPRVEACGTVDELNAAIATVRARALPDDVDRLLERVQHELFCVGAALAAIGSTGAAGNEVGARHVAVLEQAIDRHQAELPPLTQFILPGGEPSAAGLHLVRTICRRAERRVVSLAHGLPAGDQVYPAVRYLNRLSDLLFVLARVMNVRSNVCDVAWNKGAEEVPE
ncbi:MAG: cob(I)yrinic acid a,c-diamide adenosyltransferase [Planctomycetes bacterium]|nr:cob(I)yrinic acid a,c-diamide adenosyltransferase [Planctomycetota bacterium]